MWRLNEFHAVTHAALADKLHLFLYLGDEFKGFVRELDAARAFLRDPQSGAAA